MPEKNLPKPAPLEPDKVQGPGEWSDQNNLPEIPGPEPVTFPWLMFFVAVIFDLIGLVPLLNFFTEALAGLIFGFWQKMYNPKLDPILTFIVAKIIDALSLGFLPSNEGIVIYAYLKKKTFSKIQSGQIKLKATANNASMPKSFAK